MNSSDIEREAPASKAGRTPEQEARVLDAAQVEARLKESRLRLQSRFEQIGTAVDREVKTVRAVRDAFVAVLGVAGVLMTARQMAKSAKRKRKRRKRKRS